MMDGLDHLNTLRPKPEFNKDVEDILENWKRTGSFAAALELHKQFLLGYTEPPYSDGPLDPDCRELVPDMLNLFDYGILPYSFDICIKEEDEGSDLGRFKIRQKPHLCIMMLERDNPKELVTEIEKTEGIIVYASNLKGEVIAGYYQSQIPISQVRIADWLQREELEAIIEMFGLDGDDIQSLRRWRTYCSLATIHTGLKAFAEIHVQERPWLIDIWVRDWNRNVNLGRVVEQAAYNCTYCRFVDSNPGTPWNDTNKVSLSSQQKRYKCEICDKRFVTPSSLQTHMYSHTGEKPFVCDVEGCGRHFSVLSNMRRHRKCIHRHAS